MGPELKKDILWGLRSGAARNVEGRRGDKNRTDFLPSLLASDFADTHGAEKYIGLSKRTSVGEETCLDLWTGWDVGKE